MKTAKTLLKFSALLGLVLISFGGCGGDGGSSNVSGGMYMGVGFYDPWYYGGYYHDHDVIVTPPDRPDRPVRPEQPIARPPASTPRPMPSIPRTPMARGRR